MSAPTLSVSQTMGVAQFAQATAIQYGHHVWRL